MCICSCIPAFLHVENVGQDLVVAEVEAEEAEAQEEQQLQEFEVAEEDQVTTTDFGRFVYQIPWIPLMISIGPYAMLSAIVWVEL